MTSATITLSEALSRAVAAYENGKLADSERQCHAILTARPDHFEALHLLAMIQGRSGRQKDAIATSERALALRPEHAPALNNRGAFLRELKRFDEALASFDKVLAIKPHDVLALTNRGGTLSLLKRFHEALTSYDKAIALKPDHTEALYGRGNVLQKLRRFEEALESYDQAIALDPDYADAFNNRGTVLEKLNRLAEALVSYQRALAVQPNHVAALENCGGVLWKLRRFDEALASYDNSSALAPDRANGFHNRGVVLETLNRLDEALASFEKAIALLPDNADTLHARGTVLAKLNRPAEALESYKKAIALNPDYGPIYLKLVPVPDPSEIPEMNSARVYTKTNHEQTRRAFWCLGMQASASTWTYNVTRQIAVALYPTLPLPEHSLGTPDDALRLDEPGRMHIFKTHDIENEETVVALSARADVIIVTIRDPRDAVSSLMSYHPHGYDLCKPSEAARAFEQSVLKVEKSARFCARFVDEARCLLLRYEIGFVDDVTTLDRIAATFHRPLSEADRARIFASSRRSAIEAVIAQLPRQPNTVKDISSDDFVDPVTHWHTHHAGRSGEIGRWRHSLSKAQASEVERRLGDWMRRFSYQ